jgi:stearoyl-CoA desaturase (delta-9 desaturase)
MIDTESPVNIVTRLPKRLGMNWLTTIVFALFHVGAIAALFMFSWTNLAVALFLLWMCPGLGISM